MKLVKIGSELYQVSITYANQVYSIISTNENWCKDGFALLDDIKRGLVNA